MGPLSLRTIWQASSPRIKLLRAITASTKRRYSKQVKKDNDQDHLVEERAPSTAEEFQRVAEEKTRDTADKAQDAAIESAHQDSSTPEPVNKIVNPGTQSSG